MSEILREIKFFTKSILSKFGELFTAVQQVITIVKNYAFQNRLEFLYAILISVWVYGMFYLFGKDPYKIATTYRITSTSLTMFGLFLLLMTFTFIRTRKQIFKNVPDASNSPNFPSIFGFNLKIIIIAVIGYYLIQSFWGAFFKIMEQGFAKSIVSVILDAIMVGGLIALGYKLLSSTILNRFGKTKSLLLLIVNFILYIPCQITKVFEYIHQQVNITPNVTWFILLVELTFVLGYFAFPYLTKLAMEKNGILMQKEPIYLNRETVLASVFELKPKENTSWLNNFDPDKKVDYNFSISSWLRINPQPPNAIGNKNETVPILSYGGKPNIIYNVRDNRFEVSVIKKDGSQHIVYSDDNFPLQKWNHIVLNFESGTLDVFMNGTLLISETGLLTPRNNEPIIAGDKRGVEGAIRNVYYFPYILSKQQIKSLNLDL